MDLYKSNPSVQVHGPGFSKILLGDDVVDNWHDFLDVMVDSVLVNSGRSCISCSGIWASRHTEEIAEALAKRLGPIAPLPPEDPDSALAAFTVSGVAASISDQIDKHLDEEGAKDITAEYRDEGRGRLVENERCDYLRPTVIHCDSPKNWLSNQEYMFPFVSVVKCPQREMIGSIGPTLVGSAITEDEQFRRNLVDAVHIDRLNIGAIPTIQLNWLQPHEGSIVDFLFRARAYQEF